MPGPIVSEPIFDTATVAQGEDSPLEQLTARRRSARQWEGTVAATLRKDALFQTGHGVASGRGHPRVASVAKSAHEWEGSVFAITPLSNSAGSGNPQLETEDIPSSADLRDWLISGALKEGGGGAPARPAEPNLSSSGVAPGSDGAGRAGRVDGAGVLGEISWHSLLARDGGELLSQDDNEIPLTNEVERGSHEKDSNPCAKVLRAVLAETSTGVSEKGCTGNCEDEAEKHNTEEA